MKMLDCRLVSTTFAVFGIAICVFSTPFAVYPQDGVPCAKAGCFNNTCIRSPLKRCWKIRGANAVCSAFYTDMDGNTSSCNGSAKLTFDEAACDKGCNPNGNAYGTTNSCDKLNNNMSFDFQCCSTKCSS